MLWDFHHGFADAYANKVVLAMAIEFCDDICPYFFNMYYSRAVPSHISPTLGPSRK